MEDEWTKYAEGKSEGGIGRAFLVVVVSRGFSLKH